MIELYHWPMPSRHKIMVFLKKGGLDLHERRETLDRGTVSFHPVPVVVFMMPDKGVIDIDNNEVAR